MSLYRKNPKMLSRDRWESSAAQSPGMNSFESSGLDASPSTRASSVLSFLKTGPVGAARFSPPCRELNSGRSTTNQSKTLGPSDVRRF